MPSPAPASSQTSCGPWRRPIRSPSARRSARRRRPRGRSRRWSSAPAGAGTPSRASAGSLSSRLPPRADLQVVVVDDLGRAVGQATQLPVRDQARYGLLVEDVVHEFPVVAAAHPGARQIERRLVVMVLAPDPEDRLAQSLALLLERGELSVER